MRRGLCLVHLELNVQVTVRQAVSLRGGLMMFCNCEVKLVDVYDLGGRRSEIIGSRCQLYQSQTLSSVYYVKLYVLIRHVRRAWTESTVSSCTTVRSW